MRSWLDDFMLNYIDENARPLKEREDGHQPQEDRHPKVLFTPEEAQLVHLLREDDDMDRQSRHYQSRPVENNRIKSISSDSFIPKNRNDAVDESQYDRDDRTSRSGTPSSCPSCPSMTHCPSASAASSITACDNLADAGQCHSCQSLSDVENYHYQNSDAEDHFGDWNGEEWCWHDFCGGTEQANLNKARLSSISSPRTHPVILHDKKPWTSQYSVNHGYNKLNRVQNEVIRFVPVNAPVLGGDSWARKLDGKGDIRTNGGKITPSPISRNGVSGGGAQSQQGLRNNEVAVVDESDNGDDENEECDDEEDDSDENDWSGQDDNLEARLVEALGNDLPLAAYLIPHLYKVLHSEMSAKITRTVGPWCNAVTKCSPDGGQGNGRTSSYGAAANTSNSDDRKRSRGLDSISHDHEPDDEDDDEEEDEDDKRDPKRSRNHRDSGGLSPNPRLACPFYKLDSSKYGVQHESIESGKKTDFRVCAGPGFKSITRLKEHLKRKHYPVQCERCYRIFEGSSDRAVRALDLLNHRQLRVSCDLGDPSLKEGISDAQWASLDRKKKNQGSTNIEKWNEIWVILFPDTPCPKTPWYDHNLSERPSPPPSEGCSQFLDLFKAILNHKIGQQHIRLEEGMQSRIVTAVQAAFETWYRTFRSDRGLSSTETSSGQHTSYLDGSYQQVSHSRSRTNRQSNNSQAYSADILGSSSGSTMMKHGQGPRDNAGMDPRFMPHAPHYTLSGIGVGLSAEPRTHQGYPVEGLNSFVNNPFPDDSMEADSDQYFMAYDASNAHFNDPNVTARTAFADPSGGINPSQTLISSPGNPTHHNLAGYPPSNWPHPYAGQGRTHYGGGQT